MKKTWENPNLANLALGETKTPETTSVINGTCDACGKTGITLWETSEHGYVVSKDYIGFLCQKGNGSTGGGSTDQVQPS